jgi:hypothetical protein
MVKLLVEAQVLKIIKFKNISKNKKIPKRTLKIIIHQI